MRWRTSSWMKNGLPFRLPVPGLADAFLDVVAGEGGQQAGDLGNLEGLHIDVLDTRLPGDHTEQIDQRVVRIEFDVGIGAEDEDPLPRDEADQVADHGHSRAVGPVQVVEHEEDGRPPRPGHQELGHGVEEAEPLLLRRDRRRLGEVDERVADAGDQLGQRSGAGAEVGPQLLRGRPPPHGGRALRPAGHRAAPTPLRSTGPTARTRLPVRPRRRPLRRGGSCRCRLLRRGARARPGRRSRRGGGPRSRPSSRSRPTSGVPVAKGYPRSDS